MRGAGRAACSQRTGARPMPSKGLEGLSALEAHPAARFKPLIRKPATASSLLIGGQVEGPDRMDPRPDQAARAWAARSLAWRHRQHEHATAWVGLF